MKKIISDIAVKFYVDGVITHTHPVPVFTIVNGSDRWAEIVVEGGVWKPSMKGGVCLSYNFIANKVIKKLISAKAVNEFINFGTPENSVLVLKAEVMYIIGGSNQCEVFIKNQNRILSNRTLKDIEVELGNVEFCRIHNSYIVAAAFIKSVGKGSRAKITMDDARILNVSDKYEVLFNEWSIKYNL